MNKVFLRPLSDLDINENYLSWFNNKHVTKFLEVDGSSLTKQLVIDYIKNGTETNSYYMYAVCLKKNNKHIGNLKIGPINSTHGYSDLVTVIGDENEWGKGHATEAIKLGIDLAFKKYRIRKLTAGVYSDNVASLKAYTSAGFFIEGTLKKQFIVDNKINDKIIISCFNPELETNE